MTALRQNDYSTLWDRCASQRGDVPWDHFRDVVMALLALRHACARSRPGVKIPSAGTFEDLHNLSRRRLPLQSLGDRVLIPWLEVNEIHVLDGLRALDQWERRKLKALIGVFADPSIDWGRVREAGRIHEALWTRIEIESADRRAGAPVVIQLIVGELLKMRYPDPPTRISIYDPFCGAGNLLIEAGRALGRGRDVTLYGQTTDPTIAAHARLNSLVHGHPRALIESSHPISHPLLESVAGDTDQQEHELRRFDFVVSNLPFPLPSPGRIDPARDPWGRFTGCNIDRRHRQYHMAFLHLVKVLKPSGLGAVIMPGTVFQAGAVAGGWLTPLYRDGLITEVIEIPAAGCFEPRPPPPLIVVIRGERGA